MDTDSPTERRAEDEREIQEELRLTAERLRRDAETRRETSEHIREQAERVRIGAEQERRVAETLRRAVEDLRVHAEQERRRTEEERQAVTAQLQIAREMVVTLQTMLEETRLMFGKSEAEPGPESAEPPA